MRRLNCGCGNVPLQGYYNIDKHYYPGSDNPLTDKGEVERWKDEEDSVWIYGDAVELPFSDESFDEVIMVHVLEHLSKADGERALKQAFRVLKPGGTLEVEVPDLKKGCELFLKNGAIDRTMGLFYGSFGKEGEGQFHLYGYDHDSLKGLMSEGLDDVHEIGVGFGHGNANGGHPEPQFDFRLRGTR